MSTRTPTVRQMGPRKREPVEQAETPRPRVRVEQTQRPGGAVREYAPKVFEGGPRGQEVPVEASDVQDAPSGPALPADRAEGGGPIIAESNRVIGRGGSAPAPRRAAPATAAPGAGGARRGPPRASWLGGEGQTQDQVVVEAQQRQEGTVHPDQIIHREEPGPATPSGEPCTCVYEWELDEAANEVQVWIKDHPGLASSMRGAPRWMTWCVVCGGERDGQFRPENAIRYGNMMPEVQPAIDAQQVMGSVTEEVMDRVADYLGSDAFMDRLSERLAQRMTPPPVPSGG